MTRFTVYLDVPNCNDPSELILELEGAIHTECNLAEYSIFEEAKVIAVSDEPFPETGPEPTTQAKQRYFYSYDFHNESQGINKFCYGTANADIDTEIGDVLDDIKANHLKEYPNTVLKIVSFNKI